MAVAELNPKETQTVTSAGKKVRATSEDADDSDSGSIGNYIASGCSGLGDWTIFSVRTIIGVFTKAFSYRDLIRICTEVGVSSTGVMGITGLFIGMVLAVQTYSQFRTVGLETSIGAVIHLSVVRELGPVLAAVMLSGRVGSAMSAEIATMRISEQTDALACLGVDPVKFLAAPRFLACILMIPLLTILADFMGLIGSTLICLQVYGIDPHHYWQHSRSFVRIWDVFVGLAKAVLFGGALGLISCHRGFNSRAGAAGVGRAATEAFVISFVAIIVLDFILSMAANSLHEFLFPNFKAHVA